MNTKQSWNSKQVAKFIGVRYRTLDSWLRSELLPEPLRPADGTGTSRQFSAGDVTRAWAVAELRRSGVSLQRIRASDVVEQLTDEAFEADDVIVFSLDNRISVIPRDDPEFENGASKTVVGREASKTYQVPIGVASFVVSEGDNLRLGSGWGLILEVSEQFKRVREKMASESEHPDTQGAKGEG